MGRSGRTEHVVEGIPVVAVDPDRAPAGVALWLSHLGGSAEKVSPELERLAAAGWYAVSFDPPGHGRRGEGDQWVFARQVLDSFRLRMWPLLGRTTLEAMRVIDWALATTGVEAPVVAGGISMGGDVAVALAGIDPRVRRVAALASTPDWARPRMHRLDEADSLLDQGQPDAYARWYRDALDPAVHPERYARDDLTIAFTSGGSDRHVPVDDAIAFRTSVSGLQQGARERITITVHDGAGHFDVDERFVGPALEFLTGGGPDAPARARGWS